MERIARTAIDPVAEALLTLGGTRRPLLVGGSAGAVRGESEARGSSVLIDDKVPECGSRLTGFEDNIMPESKELKRARDSSD